MSPWIWIPARLYTYSTQASLRRPSISSRSMQPLWLRSFHSTIFVKKFETYEIPTLGLASTIIARRCSRVTTPFVRAPSYRPPKASAMNSANEIRRTNAVPSISMIRWNDGLAGAPFPANSPKYST